MRYAWMIGAVSAVVLTGCMNFNRESTPAPEAEAPRLNPAQRETARIERAFSERTLNPLNVKRKFVEMTDSMRNGSLDFSRGEFFSGMTDAALLRQAMLTWDLEPLFQTVKSGSRVAIATSEKEQILREALTTLLAANSAKVTVVETGFELGELYDGQGAKPAEADYLLAARPVAQNLLHSWRLNRYKLPYLRRYAAASAWLELCDLRENRIVWAGTVDSSRNFVGDYGPLLWLYEALGFSDRGTIALPPAMAAVTDSARAWGNPFGPANEILVGEAFRRISLSGTILSGLSERGKSLIVQVGSRDYNQCYADAICSLLLEHGSNVRFALDHKGLDYFDSAQPISIRPADYVLICRVDYAGVTALPDAPGSGTFRRQAAVLLWAELVKMPSCEVVWCGQLSGKSDVQTDPLIFYPLIFTNVTFEEPEKGPEKVFSDASAE